MVLHVTLWTLRVSLLNVHTRSIKKIVLADCPSAFQVAFLFIYFFLQKYENVIQTSFSFNPFFANNYRKNQTKMCAIEPWLILRSFIPTVILKKARFSWYKLNFGTWPLRFSFGSAGKNYLRKIIENENFKFDGERAKFGMG